MHQSDIRRQMQREQDERRLSYQRNNAYFTIRSESDQVKPTPKLVTNLMPQNNLRARSCSPTMCKATPLSGESAYTTQHQESGRVYTPTANTEPTTKEASLTSTRSPPTNTATAVSACQITPAQKQPKTTHQALVANNTNAKEQRSAPKQKVVTQTGMDRYIKIKRKLSPQTQSGNKNKINRVDTLSSNRFALLSDNNEDVSCRINEDAPKPIKTKPPPIYIREESSDALVKSLVKLIGSNNFHIIPLTRGNLRETKVQIYSEENYRIVSKYLTEQNKKFYTYQLKSAKGLQVVIKGVDSYVEPEEVITALTERGFRVKSATNIINRSRTPQPMFKVELEPETRTLGHGMGKNMAKQYSALGAKVICVDVNEKNNEQTVSEIKKSGGTAFAYTCDVTSREAIFALVAQVQKEHGFIDIVVNNAGIMPCHPLLEHTEKEIRLMYDINVLAHFWILQAFLPAMIERNKGHIVALSSCAGLFGLPNLVPYCGTKFAVRGLMHSLAEELRLQNPQTQIKFTTIYPYMVDTGLCKNPRFRFSFMKLVDANEAAASIIQAQRTQMEEASIPRYYIHMEKISRLMPRKSMRVLNDFMATYVDSDKH